MRGREESEHRPREGLSPDFLSHLSYPSQRYTEFVSEKEQ